MSRALRLLPIILIVWIVGTFAWRLIQPERSDDPLATRQPEVPAFALPAGVARQSSVPLRRSGNRETALAQFVRKLVRTLRRPKRRCLSELKAQGVKIDGIADPRYARAVAAFLTRHGNPYERIGADRNSSVQLSLGSAGVPETFIVDGKGVIRYQFVGPIGAADVPRSSPSWRRRE